MNVHRCIKAKDSCVGVGSSPELNVAANSTTPPTQVTDAGLAVAEEHREYYNVFSRWGSDVGGLRFSGAVYFLSCGGVACVAALCFVALRCCCYRPNVHATARPRSDDDDGVETRDSAAAAAAAAAGGQDAADTSTKRPPPQVSPRLPASYNVVAAAASDQASTPSTSRRDAGGALPPAAAVTTLLDDGTERQSRVSLPAKNEKPPPSVDVRRASGRNRRRRATVAESPRPDADAAAPLTASESAGRDSAAAAGLVARNRRNVKPLRFRYKSIDTGSPAASGRPKLFRLLVVLVVWTSAVVGGPLSTVTSYACYPAGSRAFVAGAVMADAVAALACGAAARAAAGRGDVSTVIAMCCLGTIVLVYYTALVLFSLQTQQQQPPPQLTGRAAADMPLFGNTAEMLAVSVTMRCSRSSIHVFILSVTN